jgi:pectin methylesterase-like acyl-CoA thioesterase
MPNIQRSRTLQTATTSMSAAQVLATAKTFFARQNGIYAAFVEQESAKHVTLRGQGGEEIVVGVAPAGGGTSVNASSYMFDQQVAMFLAALPPAGAN